MLTIYATDVMSQQGIIGLDLNPDVTFDVCHTDEWLDSDFARRVITDIDQIDVTDTSQPVRILLALQGMTPELLCTGTKNLIRTYNLPEYKVRMGRMGENCYKYLMEIGRDKDITGVVVNAIIFSDEDMQGLPVYFSQTGKTARNADEFLTDMCELIYAGYMREAGRP